MKNIFKIFISILTISIFVTSCEIEREPYSSMAAGQITSDPEGSLESLLAGTYAQMKSWSDVMHRCGEYAGDNIVIRGSSTDAFYEFISYSRTPNNYRLQSFWDNSYKAIAQASNIIKMIEEGKNEQIDNKLGECYFMRGLNYFYLCRAYGRPYYQSPETNLGVPIVNGTPDNVLNLQLPDRSTVKATYEQAISDLKKAADLMSINNGPAYGSKEAAWALLSRVYLFMSGTWENPNREYAKLAEEYATKVISSGKYILLPRERFMTYNEILPEDNSESIFVIKRVASEYSGYDHYYGVGGMYSNIGGMGWGEMYASEKYIQLLNETGRNDWRKGKSSLVDARAAFIEPQYTDDNKVVFRFVKNLYDAGKIINYAYVQAEVKVNGENKPIVASDGSIECVDGEKTYKLTPINKEQEIYSIKYEDGNTYTGVVDFFIKLNRAYPMFYIVKCSREGEDSQLHSPIISRLGEIHLNRAEAYAKMGEYPKALIDLNLIRERSIPGAGYKSLSKEDAATLIEKERQLELAYQAERSYDVYRNGLSLKRDYPGPHPKDEVSPTDYRVVYFIPQTAINSYLPSVLTQNPTHN
jgi:SusD family.